MYVFWEHAHEEQSSQLHGQTSWLKEFRVYRASVSYHIQHAQTLKLSEHDSTLYTL